MSLPTIKEKAMGSDNEYQFGRYEGSREAIMNVMAFKGVIVLNGETKE